MEEDQDQFPGPVATCVVVIKHSEPLSGNWCGGLFAGKQRGGPLREVGAGEGAEEWRD